MAETAIDGDSSNQPEVAGECPLPAGDSKGPGDVSPACGLKSRIPVMRCPYCNHRITLTEWTAARYNYSCAACGERRLTDFIAEEV